MAKGTSITFTPDGLGHCLYDEAIDLRKLGPITCRRASHVEFNENRQKWEVLTPDRQKVLFHSSSRRICLDWERENLQPV